MNKIASFFLVSNNPPYPLCAFRTISSFYADTVLLCASCCNCRVRCDLGRGARELLCLGGLRNPHKSNVPVVGVVLSQELSFHFCVSVFLALMAGIRKLRVASWIVKQRMNKKNVRGRFYLFCYLKSLWSVGWFFRGSTSVPVTLINRLTRRVLPRFTVCQAEKAQLEFQVLTVLAHSSGEPASPRSCPPS